MIRTVAWPDLIAQIAVPLIGVPGELLLDPSVGEGEIKADQGNGYSQQGGQEETKLKAVQ